MVASCHSRTSRVLSYWVALNVVSQYWRMSSIVFTHRRFPLRLRLHCSAALSYGVATAVETDSAVSPLRRLSRNDPSAYHASSASSVTRLSADFRHVRTGSFFITASAPQPSPFVAVDDTPAWGSVLMPFGRCIRFRQLHGIRVAGSAALIRCKSRNGTRYSRHCVRTTRRWHHTCLLLFPTSRDTLSLALKSQTTIDCATDIRTSI
ncbi:hypothetical protein EXIGLDRAFT_284869 [Exidia glandulosa HHB12029]|uniref:Uncharacterized protein n=1 Tax=Exidia glandulosa HHB12029 TaxID=1314781 RepID=A0A165M3Q5_EXIGL|nr:hypothetical protein EXIGLDRAFT_284869 [Exidia glandulosa HHB12029]